MPGTRCSVVTCTNSGQKTRQLTGKPKVKYHVCPSNGETHNAWLQACQRGDSWNPTNFRICSEHFAPEDYERDLQAELLNYPSKKRTLKKYAVPHLKLPTSENPDSLTQTAQLITRTDGVRKALLELTDDDTSDPLQVDSVGIVGSPAHVYVQECMDETENMFATSNTLMKGPVQVDIMNVSYETSMKKCRDACVDRCINDDGGGVAIKHEVVYDIKTETEDDKSAEVEPFPIGIVTSTLCSKVIKQEPADGNTKEEYIIDSMGENYINCGSVKIKQEPVDEKKMDEYISYGIVERCYVNCGKVEIQNEPADVNLNDHEKRVTAWSTNLTINDGVRLNESRDYAIKKEPLDALAEDLSINGSETNRSANHNQIQFNFVPEADRAVGTIMKEELIIGNSPGREFLVKRESESNNSDQEDVESFDKDENQMTWLETVKYQVDAVLDTSDKEAYTEDFKCKICGKSFSYRRNLARHVRSHTGVKPFQCLHCHKSFNERSDVIRHERSHSREKLYECTLCAKSFIHQGSLTVHVRSHSQKQKKSRPFICDICKKCFAQVGHLVSHRRTHTGEKPFPCNVCGKSFSKRSDLLRHERRHEGLRPYKCNLCEKTFPQQWDLTRHLQSIVHNGAPQRKKIKIKMENSFERITYNGT